MENNKITKIEHSGGHQILQVVFENLGNTSIFGVYVSLSIIKHKEIMLRREDGISGVNV